MVLTLSMMLKAQKIWDENKVLVPTRVVLTQDELDHANVRLGENFKYGDIVSGFEIVPSVL